MKTLCVLGPFDRYNYGDLIFPLIIEYYFKEKYDAIEYFGILDSDLSEFGGKKTLKSSEIFSRNNYDIIVAGGQSYCAHWGYIASYLDRRLDFLRHLNNIPLVGMPILNFIGKKILNYKRDFPFTIYKLDYPNVNKIFYNSLGGISTDNSKAFLDKIRTVDYISLRDNLSYNAAKKYYPNVSLVPDSALLMSEVFPLSSLSKKYSESLVSFLDNNKRNGYIVFQVNKHKGMRNLDLIVKKLKILSNKHSCKIALCVIGYAYGHEDQTVLKKIHNMMSNDTVLFDNNSIWDIMGLIANSKFYIGTSLHGVITAMSYKKPYIGLEVEKLKDYITTWGVEPLNILRNFNNMELDLDFEGLDIKLLKAFEEQKMIVINSFNKM